MQTNQTVIAGPTLIPDRPGYVAYRISGDTCFEVPASYHVLRAVGTGAYGVVAAAEDTRTGQRVAIKKITGVYNNLTDALRVLREISLMRHLCGHPNVLSICDLDVSASGDDIYIYSPLFESDLHRVIYSRQPLSDAHIQWFVYQMLAGVRWMHSASVIHRDLKPANILVNADCTLNIADFGLARGVASSSILDDDLTEYVVTRWYRAPEVMLSCQEYSRGVDVWGVGCIWAELLCGEPLFQGNDYLHQLRLIVDHCGSPDDDDIVSTCTF